MRSQRQHRIVPVALGLGIAIILTISACTPAQESFTLTVGTAGTGSGVVTSSPSGIDTDAVDGSQASFQDGTVVTLTAAAAADSAFVGWGGACSGETGATCDVTMDEAKTVSATFDGLGTLFFSQDSNGNGLYVIDLQTGVATLAGAGTSGTTDATIGLAGRGATDPLVGSTFSTLVDIAQDGSSATQFSVVSAEGLTYVASTDLVYAIINGSFQSVSPSTGLQVEDLTDPPGGLDLEGIAADEASGVIYGLPGEGAGTTSLWVYDIATDAWTEGFDTGLSWNDPGMAFSDAEGVLYAIGEAGSSDTVYRFDPVAETVAAVGSTGLALNEGGLAWVPSP